jgi:FkbM family methyltransferase
MKLREILYLFGLRPAVRTYPVEVVKIALERDGEVEFAHWRHPKVRYKTVTQAYLDDLRTFVREGDVCIDIGAHCGDTTVPMALAAGRTGMVVALEPNPYVFAALEANSRLNRERTNVVALNAAATNEDGTYTFEYSDPGFCNGGRHEGIGKLKHAHFFPLEVRGVNLVRWLAEHHPDAAGRLRYVKTDTEGYDLVVLRSLEPLLRAARPIVRAEVYKHSPRADREALYDFLAGLDYELFVHESVDRHQGPPIARSEVMDRPTFDFFALPRGR